MNLSEFLLARFEDDEADVALGMMRVSGPGSPYRIRLDLEAKRRIVGRHAAVNGAEDWMDEDWLADMTPEEKRGICGWCTYDNRAIWSPCLDLRLLALPYADHPDYLEEWSPDAEQATA